MFEQEIEQYENVRQQYVDRIVSKMSQADYMDWHEILFTCHWQRVFEVPLDTEMS